MRTTLKLHLCITVALLSLPALARAQGTTLAYEGRLMDGGSPGNGSFDFIFTAHDAESGGNTVGQAVGRDAVMVSTGKFVVQLDFGPAVFTGPPRWLQMQVRRNGNAAAHVALAPRQKLLPTPYVLHAATAGSVANGTIAATQLNTGGVPPMPGQILSYDGGNLLWTDPAAGGGGGWSGIGTNAYTAGNVGIGTSTITPGYRLDVNGPTLLRPANGTVQFGSPNGELGMSITPTFFNGRADVRFDGSLLKLVAGVGQGPPPSSNGIVISAAGNVGVGTSTLTPGYRLEVEGATLLKPANGTVQVGSPNGELGMSLTPTAVESRADLRFDGSVLKLSAGPGRVPPSAANGVAITTVGNVGVGTTTPVAKLEAETSDAKPAVYGNATGAGTGVYGRSVGGAAVYAEGNAAQLANRGGFVKAMAYINPFLPADQYVVNCFNSQQSGNAASTAPCGITVTRIQTGHYAINFGFNVETRFFSLTSRGSYGGEGGLTAGTVNGVTGNQVTVVFSEIGDHRSVADTAFYIVVY